MATIINSPGPNSSRDDGIGIGMIIGIIVVIAVIVLLAIYGLPGRAEVDNTPNEPGGTGANVNITVPPLNGGNQGGSGSGSGSGTNTP